MEEHHSLLLPLPLRKMLDRGSTWLDERGWIRPAIFQEPCLPTSQTGAITPNGFFEGVRNGPDSLQAFGRWEGLGGHPLREAVILTYRDEAGRCCFAGIDNSGNPAWTISIPNKRLKQPDGRLEAWLLDSETGQFRKLRGIHAYHH